MKVEGAGRVSEIAGVVTTGPVTSAGVAVLQWSKTAAGIEEEQQGCEALEAFQQPFSRLKTVALYHVVNCQHVVGTICSN